MIPVQPGDVELHCLCAVEASCLVEVYDVWICPVVSWVCLYHPLQHEIECLIGVSHFPVLRKKLAPLLTSVLNLEGIRVVHLCLVLFELQVRDLEL
jgi:hypothetical protein